MRRRLLIFGIIVVVIGLIVGSFFYFGVRKAPSCTDNVQNQSEEGIDCGGPCPYLCTMSETAPSVRFIRPISPLPGRTDVVAYVDNPNGSAAIHGASYTIELYDANNAVVAKKDGVVDLLPASTAAVFVPNFFSGSRTATHAFLTFHDESIKWYRYQETRQLPTVNDIQPQLGDAPRVTATVVNPSSVELTNLLLVATVFDADGNAIAASQTVAPSVPAQGAAPIIFTWPVPFSAPVSKVEVVPVLQVASAPSV